MTKQAYLIFGAILVLLVAGAVFVWEKRQTTVTPPPISQPPVITPTPPVVTPPTTPTLPTTPTPSTPEGWKTYRNEEFGFEISYPEGWIVEENDVKTTFSIFNKKIHEEESTIVKNSEGTDAGPYEFLLRIFKFNGEIEDFIKLHHGTDIVERKEVVFTKTDMKGVILTDNVYPTDFTVFLSREYVFEFFSFGGIKSVWDKYGYKNSKEIDDSIISTFKFFNKKS